MIPAFFPSALHPREWVPRIPSQCCPRHIFQTYCISTSTITNEAFLYQWKSTYHLTASPEISPDASSSCWRTICDTFRSVSVSNLKLSFWSSFSRSDVAIYRKSLSFDAICKRIPGLESISKSNSRLCALLIHSWSSLIYAMQTAEAITITSKIL